MLSPVRHGSWLHDADPEGNDDERSPFEADIDRLAFDGHMRLLGDKTQVHRAGSGTTARSRLSHSIEVSRVGRSIGAAFVAGTDEAAKDERLSADVQDILQAAGLTHDIGNPPFGHRGEDAISSFFKTDAIGKTLLGDSSEAITSASVAREFTEFDGNAQGMRHALRNGGWHPKYGLRLTAATLCAAAKYPWTGIRPGRKRSVFTTDAGRFGCAAALCGMPATGADSWGRHPLSYLCEAADDLSYAVVDIEDGAMLGVIDHDEAEALLIDIIPRADMSAISRIGRIDPGRRVAYLRSQAISELIRQAGAAARANREAIMEGSLRCPLSQKMPSGPALDALKTFAAERIYTSANARADEAGWAIGTIMSHAAKELVDTRGRKPNNGHNSIAHALCDLISSLTDNSCTSLARAIAAGQHDQAANRWNTATKAGKLCASAL
jgi:dGTPase